MIRRHAALAVLLATTLAVSAGVAVAERQAPRCSDEMSALLLRHARRHGVPIDLLHRVVIRESRYNPAAHHSRYFGLMQITYATARSMGYAGSPAGLLDPDVNLTYGVPYLANAYMLSRGNDDRAVRLYASGYYGTAKQQHMIAALRTADSPPVVPVRVIAEAPRNPVSRLFGMLTGAPAPAPAETAPAAAPADAAAVGEAAPKTSIAAAPPAATADVAATDRAADGQDRTARRHTKAVAHPVLVAKAKSPPATQAAAADAAPPEAPADDRLRGSVDRLPETFRSAADATQPGTATAQADASPAPAPRTDTKKVARVRLAAAKGKPSKSAPAAAESVPEPDQVADAEPQSADAAPDADAPVRMPAHTKAGHGKRAPKRLAVADGAHGDDVSPESTNGRPAPAVTRHARAVVQAAASKAELEPHEASEP